MVYRFPLFHCLSHFPHRRDAPLFERLSQDLLVRLFEEDDLLRGELLLALRTVVHLRQQSQVHLQLARLFALEQAHPAQPQQLRVRLLRLNFVLLRFTPFF